MASVKLPPRRAGSGGGKRTPNGKAAPGRRGGRGEGRVLATGCAFTSEVTEAILGFAEAGMPRKYAAGKVGIGERTLQRWVERGRDNLDEIDAALDDAPVEVDGYGAFLKRLIVAESYARGDVLDLVRKAAGGDWRAGAWILERADSREFGQSHKVEGVTRNEHGDEESAGDLLIDKIAEIASRQARNAGDSE